MRLIRADQKKPDKKYYLAISNIQSGLYLPSRLRQVHNQLNQIEKALESEIEPEPEPETKPETKKDDRDN